MGVEGIQTADSEITAQSVTSTGRVFTFCIMRAWRPGIDQKQTLQGMNIRPVQGARSLLPLGAQVRLPKVAGVGVQQLPAPQPDVEAFSSTPPNHSCSLGYF